MHIRTIGIVGAGVMGVGIAEVLGRAGYDILLLDTSEEQLHLAKKNLQRSLRLHAMLNKEAGTRGSNNVLPRINYTQDYNVLQMAELVIESATESWEVKREIFGQLDSICPAECVLTSNTSTISITRIASVTKRPAKVIGTHFMNPAPMKQVVETIRGYHTSAETVETVRQVLAQAGRRCIVVNDVPGFVSNRVLMLTINEAIFLLEGQVATKEEIDDLFRSCFSHKMGPLETADLIGLDTVLASIEVLYESFHDSKYRPCPLLMKMVDAGLYGQKSGRGFYAYGDN
jgi:3-hydroxybutyryl-CoA dehydrogenase